MSGPAQVEASRRRAVLRGAGLVLVITVAARVVGFLRYLVFGGSVGAGDVGTAYASANLLPNVLFEIVAGGALAAIVVPLVAGLVPEQNTAESADEVAGAPADESADAAAGAAAGVEGRASAAEGRPAGEGSRSDGTSAAPGTADRVISALLTWGLVVTIPLALVLILAAEPIARILLGTADAGVATVALGTRLLRVFAPQLPLYAIAVVLAAYLQARRRFLWPALMPLLSSLVVIVSYRVYAALVPPVATAATIPDAAANWLGWGTTAGVLVMAASVAIAALRCGLKVRPALTMPPGYGERARALGAAGVAAVAAQQGVMGLILLLAMRSGGTGTLPVYQYAQALYLLPYAVLVMPLLTSAFPHLSELRLVGDTMQMARMAAASVRTILIVSVLGAVALFAAAPALEQFFRLVDRAGASGVGAATAALALGLPGFAVSMQCSRILAAALRSRDALIAGSAGWLAAGALVLVAGMPAPSRSAALAATAFGLACAAGMAIGGIIGLSRIRDLLEVADAQREVRRAALVSPLALAAGAIPGMLLTRTLVTTGTTEAQAVLAGALGALAGALLALAVLAAADLSRVRALLRTAAGPLRRASGRGGRG